MWLLFTLLRSLAPLAYTAGPLSSTSSALAERLMHHGIWSQYAVGTQLVEFVHRNAPNKWKQQKQQQLNLMILHSGLYQCYEYAMHCALHTNVDVRTQWTLVGDTTPCSCTRSDSVLPLYARRALNFGMVDWQDLRHRLAAAIWLKKNRRMQYNSDRNLGMRTVSIWYSKWLPYFFCSILFSLARNASTITSEKKNFDGKKMLNRKYHVPFSAYLTKILAIYFFLAQDDCTELIEKSQCMTEIIM